MFRSYVLLVYTSLLIQYYSIHGSSYQRHIVTSVWQIGCIFSLIELSQSSLALPYDMPTLFVVRCVIFSDYRYWGFH